MLSRAAVVYGVLIEQDDATRDELIARVRKALGLAAYGAAPEDALLRDVKWLKQLGYEIVPTEGYRYRLVRFDPLLPLTREDVETLAAVRKALAATLYAESIEHLVSGLRPFLQPNLRPLLDTEPLLKLSAPLLDNLAPQQTTLRLFRRAREQRRQLYFNADALEGIDNPTPLLMRHWLELLRVEVKMKSDNTRADVYTFLPIEPAPIVLRSL